MQAIDDQFEGPAVEYRAVAGISDQASGLEQQYRGHLH
jgi:hypothetical protein